MKKFMKNLLVIVFVFSCPIYLAAQNNNPNVRDVKIVMGPHSGTIKSDAQIESNIEYGKQNMNYTNYVVTAIVVNQPGAAIMRLFFDDVNLGNKSFILIKSALDGGTQRLNALTLEQWENSSAFFNGDEVEIQLLIAPNEVNVGLTVNSIYWISGDPLTPESQCGATDDRVTSTTNQVGRIMPVGCSGWQIPNGSFLTAGHCVGSTMSILQFNVPQSLADGTTVAANPNDQYPIISSSIVFQNSNGTGDDWCVFKVNPNSNTNLLPFEANGPPNAFNQNFYRCTKDILPSTSGNTTRITGFGVDQVPAGSTGGLNSKNQTNQTAIGGFDAETGSGSSVGLLYTVDTEGGNSGSPVIIQGTNNTIGIHTNAGCTNTGGANQGTSFEEDDLEVAIQNSAGSNTTYVDANHPSFFTIGTMLNPYHALSSAITNAASGNTLSIVEGLYAENIVINTNLVLKAPVGLVVISPNPSPILVAKITEPEASATESKMVANHNLKVSPNPAANFIIAKISDGNSRTLYKIYNSTMQLVKLLNVETGIENKIPISDLSPGIYLIDAQTGGQSYKTKFVVSR